MLVDRFFLWCNDYHFVFFFFLVSVAVPAIQRNLSYFVSLGRRTIDWEQIKKYFRKSTHQLKQIMNLIFKVLFVDLIGAIVFLFGFDEFK